MNAKTFINGQVASKISYSFLAGLTVEFYHLRSFVAVAQTGNLTRAAKRLYSTPPAISAHIKALEQELSTTLFVRSTKGMTLTTKGESLLLQAQKTLDSAINLVNLAAENQHQIIGDFQLALNTSNELLRLTQLAENLKENCPGIQLSVHSLATGQIINAIREHRLDGGFIYGDVPNDMLAINIANQAITTIAPLDLIQTPVTRIQSLTSYPWIKMSEDCPFDNELKHRLGNDLISVIQSSCNNSRLALVEQGLGLSFIEQQLAKDAEKTKQITRISLLDFQIPLNFIVDKKRMSEPVIKAMLQEIRILWQIAL